MRLREIPPQAYAREVLPLTAPLWAGRRTFDEYVAQTLEIFCGAYGRRHVKTIGLYDGRTLVASFKRYERTLRHDERSLRAMGVGAVFTPVAYRGRGYASVMLAMALDRARARGYDVAYLFSDIPPQFYAAVGFEALPSRRFSLRADALPSMRLDLTSLGDGDWSAVRRIFRLGHRRCGFARTAAEWGWIRMRVRQGCEHPVGHETNLVLRGRSGVDAYVLGVRAPERDVYVIDEFGVTGESAAAVPALLRAAAGDLRRVSGWLPPGPARALLPKHVARKRDRAILMMAPLGSRGRSLLRSIRGFGTDFCWATDHI